MFEADEMESCHSCKYGDEFDTEKEPCKYCYGLSMYTKKVNACSECEFFNDSRFYAYNSILVSWGSCMKCQRNMTTTNPYQETPTWCPLKGDEDGNNTGND